MYFYIFNDREMVDLIHKATNQPYKIFGRGENGIVYSFEKTQDVLISYKTIKAMRKYKETKSK